MSRNGCVRERYSQVFINSERGHYANDCFYESSIWIFSIRFDSIWRRKINLTQRLSLHLLTSLSYRTLWFNRPIYTSLPDQSTFSKFFLANHRFRVLRLSTWAFTLLPFWRTFCTTPKRVRRQINTQTSRVPWKRPRLRKSSSSVDISPLQLTPCQNVKITSKLSGVTSGLGFCLNFTTFQSSYLITQPEYVFRSQSAYWIGQINQYPDLNRITQ